ncbi:MAG: hypothetical protein H7258_01240 [Ferruginibacter sp.]|nr:hypothetical protein [Ferruginibacter sp.]
MIFFSKLILSLFWGIFFLIVASCGEIGSKKDFSNSPMYDFANPKVIKLPQELDEISGIAYYAKDTSVFAIIDEDGLLFKIPLKQPANVRQWKFDKKRDFEDIVLVDSTFYVLVSDGDIERIVFKGDNITTSRSKFSDFSASGNEFEILYASEDSSGLVLVCKTCEGDAKKTISRFSYNYTDSVRNYKPMLSLNMAPVAEKLGINKHLKASAAAINPVTKDLYMVSSIQKLVVVFDAKGDFKELYKLDPALYKQPEGIAFTPAGDLIISNEFAGDGFATLLIMKNKRKEK